ncbi:suppressor of fused domain protein [Tomitella gaofuii]|uniref:suppressor of fused domain protein n=1 Tax=Tomitella gaofuii TaxID=2760083 RepID=UPI0015F7F440
MAGVVDNVIEQVEAHLVQQFGGPPAGAASVTFLGLEPIVVQAFVAAGPGPGRPAAGDGDTLLHLVSVGCSRAPMADPTEMVADPQRGPRAEIVVALRPTGGGVPEGLHRSVAVLAAAPAVEGVVLAPDGIIDLAEPMWRGCAFSAVLLGESDMPDLTLAPPRDPVRFLEAVPITATEAAWVRVRGADELRAAWAEAQVDPRDPGRRAVAL